MHVGGAAPVGDVGAFDGLDSHRQVDLRRRNHVDVAYERDHGPRAGWAADDQRVTDALDVVVEPEHCLEVVRESALGSGDRTCVH